MDRDDLVGLALGALDDTTAQRVHEAVAADPALAAELEEIRGHLALHDHIPELQPKPALWNGIRDRLEEQPARRPFLVRFWMPAAAALLVAAAILWPHGGVATTTLHGDAVRAADGTVSCTRVSRIRVGNAATVTMDAGTEILVPDSRRLVLRTGRVFLEVTPEGRGFLVEAGDLRVETTGTAFLVDATGLVWVESGTVVCNGAPVAAGEHYPSGATLRWKSPREWFSRPTLTARILDSDTIRVVIRNEMPDTLQVAPRTGGEPLFFAGFGGRAYPLSPTGFDAPLTLQPNTEESFDLRLPRPLPDRESLLLTYPAGGMEVEATR